MQLDKTPLRPYFGQIVLVTRRGGDSGRGRSGLGTGGERLAHGDILWEITTNSEPEASASRGSMVRTFVPRLSFSIQLQDPFGHQLSAKTDSQEIVDVQHTDGHAANRCLPD